MSSAGALKAAPSPANSCWADLPHELLIRIFACQQEPLHNLAAERTCHAWAHAVRQAWAPTNDSTPRSCSEIHADRSASVPSAVQQHELVQHTDVCESC